MINIRCNGEDEKDIKCLLEKFKGNKKTTNSKIILEALLVFDKYQEQVKKAVASVWE